MSDGTLDDHFLGTAVNPGDERESIDNSAATSCSNSSVSDSLNLLISSVITGFDRTADATSRSQDQLCSALDRLTGDLDNLLEDAPSTFIMQHSARIYGVRKRVRALNSVLKSTQQRIDNMDRMISAGLMHGGFYFFSYSLCHVQCCPFNEVDWLEAALTIKRCASE